MAFLTSYINVEEENEEGSTHLFVLLSSISAIVAGVVLLALVAAGRFA